MNPSNSRSLHVIGAGLIGTSIALAAREHGLNVSVEDSRSANEALAFDLLNGKSLTSQTRSTPQDPVDFVVVAVPPDRTATEVSRALKEHPHSLIVDVASVKTKVIAEVKDLSDDFGRFIPTHPIAGRQFQGPAAAQADLFKNRPWILTPLIENSVEDVQRVESLLSALGANLHRMTAEEHDAIFARVSHLPQILSTLLSATLHDQPEVVAFSGQGFRDMTRLAESEGGLWAEIIALNSEEILNAMQDFKASLTKIERAVELKDASSILNIFKKGKSTRTFLAGKHGGVPRDYIFFRIVIDDRPGVLAELFALCGEVNVNVEDLTIEHSPNQETGLITLAIAPEQKERLEMILKKRNWKYHLNPSVGSIE